MLSKVSIEWMDGSSEVRVKFIARNIKKIASLTDDLLCNIKRGVLFIKSILEFPEVRQKTAKNIELEFKMTIDKDVE